MRHGTRRPAGRRSERGAIGGAEGLLFGMLVLVAGSIVMVNVWTVLDTRAALDAAAREYLRSYTEQPDAASARGYADEALDAVLRARGTDPDLVQVRVETPNGFGPCALVLVELTTAVRGIRAPFLEDVGSSVVQVRHRELVDAHTEVMPDASYLSTATACSGG